MYLGDISEVEEVVYLGWCGKKGCRDSVIQIQSGLSHNLSSRLHFLLKALQPLVDHGAVDAFDL